MLIESFIIKYRKTHANKLFVPMMINAFVRLIIFSLLVIVVESLFYINPPIKLLFIQYSLIIVIIIIAYPIIVWVFNYYNIFNNSKDEYFANRIGSEYNNINDKLLNALELEKELADQNSPSIELSKKAIADANKLIKNIKPTHVSLSTSIKKLGGYIILLSIIFIIFKQNFILGFNRLINPNTSYPKPLPFMLHTTSNNLEVLEGDSVKISIAGIGELPDSIDIVFRTYGNEIEKVITPLKNEMYYHIFEATQTDIIWHAEKNNSALFSLWDKIQTNSDTIFVIERPHLTEIQFQIIPPLYTNKNTYTQIGNVSEINVINGSKVIISAKSNKNLLKSWINIDSTKHEPMITRENNIIGSINIINDISLSISCQDIDGIENLNSITYKFNTIADTPPSLFVSLPNDGFQIDETNLIPFKIQVSDEYGISNIWIDYFIQSDINKANEEGNYTTLNVNNWDGDLKNQIVEFDWDVAKIDIDLNEKLHIVINVADNNIFPSPSVSSSNPILALYPSIEDLFNSIEEEEEIIEDYNEEIILTIDEVQELVKEMELKLLKSDDMSWDEEKKASNILDNMEDVFNQINEMQKSLQNIEEQAEKNNLISNQLMDKFEKFQKLLDNIMTDELMQAMDKMREAMESMDKEKMMEALENFDYDLKAFEEEIDRFIDMFEQAIAEQKVDELVKTIKKMVDTQNEITDGLTKELDENLHELSNMGRQQEERFKDMKKLLNDTQQSISDFSSEASNMLSEMSESNNLKETAQNIESSRKEMQKGNGDKALSNSKNAQTGLDEMLNDIQKIKSQFQQDTLQEMLNEFLSVIINLLQITHQQENLNNLTSGLRANSPELRNITRTQSHIRQKIISSINQLLTLSKKTFYITPPIGKALGKSKNNTDKSILAFEQKRINKGIKNQDGILIGLNQSIKLLMDAMEEMNLSQSASGFDSYMEQLEQMSSQQQGINKGTMQLGQMGMMAQQMMMQKLQQQQQMLQKSLEEMLSDMPGGNQPGGLSKANEDMKKTIQDFKRKKVSEKTIKRQEEILSRMLDSQKSLQQKDYSEKRKSNPGKQFEYTGNNELPININDKQLLLIQSMESALKEGYSRDYQEMIKTYFMQLQEEPE